MTKQRIQDKLDEQLNHNLNMIGTYLERNTIEDYKQRFEGDPVDEFLLKIEIDSNGTKEIEEVDGFITLNNIPEEFKEPFKTFLDKYKERCSSIIEKPIGFGFEFRGRYGKNDDSLLQKDEHMSSALINHKVIPVLGIFSTSNAIGSIKRLEKSWLILEGNDTTYFIKECTEFDFIEYLKSRKHKIDKVMNLIHK